MTYAIDPHQSWLALEAAAAQESSPRRKALITEVRNHMEHEIKGQLDPLMDTLTGPSGLPLLGQRRAFGD